MRMSTLQGGFLLRLFDTDVAERVSFSRSRKHKPKKGSWLQHLGEIFCNYLACDLPEILPNIESTKPLVHWKEIRKYFFGFGKIILATVDKTKFFCNTLHRRNTTVFFRNLRLNSFNGCPEFFNSFVVETSIQSSPS